MTDSMAESMSPSIVGWEGCEYSEVVIAMTIASKTVTSSGMFDGHSGPAAWGSKPWSINYDLSFGASARPALPGARTQCDTRLYPWR
jgi:hypothetical protein